MTRPRTYSQSEWQTALAEWDDGEFSDEWREVRHTMAMQGCIYPPNGTRWDSWEDDQPSQRAVLIRAIRETPDVLARCMRGAASWSQVIDRLFAARDDWRADLRMAEREDDEDRVTHRESLAALGNIVRRIADSVGVDR